MLTHFQGHLIGKKYAFFRWNRRLKAVVTKFLHFNMENGQPNRLLKWKRTGKTLGITFGITFLIYFAALSYLVGAKLIMPILVSGMLICFCAILTLTFSSSSNNNENEHKIINILICCSFKLGSQRHMALWISQGIYFFRLTPIFFSSKTCRWFQIIFVSGLIQSLLVTAAIWKRYMEMTAFKLNTF